MSWFHATVRILASFGILICFLWWAGRQPSGRGFAFWPNCESSSQSTLCIHAPDVRAEHS